MTDFERPVHDPTTDTTATEVPATPIATTPLGTPDAAPAPANPRRSRARWLAALAIVAMIVGITALATLSLTGSAPASTVVGYVPADSLAYGELRLDLPGDQRQKIGEFLSKFPGFADQAALETKLDEVLDRLLAVGTDDKQTYTRDIKPWFDGELAFSMGPLPTDPTALKDPASMARPRALLLMSVKDAALARSWFTAALAEHGVSGTPETYQGTELTIFKSPENATEQAAFGLVDGKVAIAGDVASVKGAIDTKGASPLAKSAAFVAAKAALKGDDLGFVFVDLRTILAAAMELSQSTTASPPPLSDALVDLVPDWAAFRLRVESDALVMDSVTPHVEAAPGPADNSANAVAAFAPPSTIVFTAGNAYGATLTETIALYRKDPALTEAFKSIDQAAGMLGGLEASIGWMGDTGLIVARNGDSIEGGIVSIPADAAAGARLLTTLRSFATLAGAQYGISVRDEDHAGTTITIIDLGTAKDLAALAGTLGGVPFADDSTVDLPGGHIEISYAATDGVVVLGSSPDFVGHVLDAGAGQSLADDARYTALVGRVGATHTAVTFVDVAAVRGLVEGLLSKATPKERAEYEESVKPFLAPFDAFVTASVTGPDLEQQHAIVTVK
jgi:hypothetical protein